jgi:hypothetical protein
VVCLVPCAPRQEATRTYTLYRAWRLSQEAGRGVQAGDPVLGLMLDIKPDLILELMGFLAPSPVAPLGEG